MKFILSFFLLLMTVPCYAFDAKLQWDVNNEPDLSGYKIYYKTKASGPPYNGTGIEVTGINEKKNSPIDIDSSEAEAINGKITVDLTGLSNSKVYYMAITAYDNAGNESHFSNEIVIINYDITISAVSGNTSEDGKFATFTVVLNAEPSADVIVNLSSSDSSEGSPTPSKLTFTDADWNSAQTVVINGHDDNLDDGDIPYSILIESVISADLNFNGLDKSDITLLNSDDDIAGITVSSISGNTSESGNAATFTIILNTKPTSDVEIPIKCSDLTECSLLHESVVFTANNWNSAQTVIVSGKDDFIADGNIDYSIITGEVSGFDPNYSHINPSDVKITNSDNDRADIIVSSISGHTSESGNSANFSVVLNTQPVDNVSIEIVSNNINAGFVSPQTLLFTSEYWMISQTVVVTGVDDDLDAGDTAYIIETRPAFSNDTKYLGLDPANVTVVNKDNDTAGIIVSSISRNTSENAGEAFFTTVLSTKPLFDVTIPLHSNNINEGIVSPDFILFSTENWNVPQTINVIGQDDRVVDGDITYAIETEVSISSDLSYDGLDPENITVVNIDNDKDFEPPLIINPTSPVSEAWDVIVNAVFVVTFNEPIDSSTINEKTFFLNNGVTGTVVYDSETKNATLIPASKLDHSTTYTITVTTDVKDILGNTLIENYSWNITTIAQSDDTDQDGVSDNEDLYFDDPALTTATTVTGTGRYTIDTSSNSNSYLKEVSAISDKDPNLNGNGKLPDYEFPHGLVKFTISNISNEVIPEIKIGFPVVSIPANAIFFEVNSNGFNIIKPVSQQGNTVSFRLKTTNIDKQEASEIIIGFAVPIGVVENITESETVQLIANERAEQISTIGDNGADESSYGCFINSVTHVMF